MLRHDQYHPSPNFGKSSVLIHGQHVFEWGVKEEKGQTLRLQGLDTHVAEMHSADHLESRVARTLVRTHKQVAAEDVVERLLRKGRQIKGEDNKEMKTKAGETWYKQDGCRKGRSRRPRRGG